MRTAYLSHPIFLQHDMGSYHPESPARLLAIEKELKRIDLYEQLQHYTAPVAEREALLRCHHADYIDMLQQAAPKQGLVALDPDTAMNPYTLEAAYRAAAAGITAVDLVLGGKADNAFCAVRPPGHHAEPGRAMGFCFFNNIAIATAHALEVHGLERIAIIDFDVHHGNGSEAIFCDDPRVLLCSSFQHPFYPGTRLDQAAENILHVPLKAGDGSREFRKIYREQIFPAVAAFGPQLLMLSAGFDGHVEDEMSGLALLDEDYSWLSRHIVELAGQLTGGRIVSMLEGGYALDALGRCAADHIAALLGSAD